MDLQGPAAAAVARMLDVLAATAATSAAEETPEEVTT
jgi:hypothetical protein